MIDDGGCNYKHSIAGSDGEQQSQINAWLSYNKLAVKGLN